MKRLYFGLICTLILTLTPLHSNALNILLCNDDGYDHPNLRALYQILKAHGHTVKVAAPYREQSARGGALFYGREVKIGRDQDPAYPDSYYLITQEEGRCESPECAGKEVRIEVSGTPVMAVLFGLEKIMKNPDLVIVGPNPGNNLGPLNNISGTFNAAATALQNGTSSIAVSVDLKEKNSSLVAKIVTRVVDILERNRQPNTPLLPPGIGLNINLPLTDSIEGIQLTRIGSKQPFNIVYTDDLGPLFKTRAGKPGISFASADEATLIQQQDEAVWLAKRYITISPFTGHPGEAVLPNTVQSVLRLGYKEHE